MIAMGRSCADALGANCKEDLDRRPQEKTRRMNSGRITGLASSHASPRKNHSGTAQCIGEFVRTATLGVFVRLCSMHSHCPLLLMPMEPCETKVELFAGRAGSSLHLMREAQEGIVALVR